MRRSALSVKDRLMVYVQGKMPESRAVYFMCQLLNAVDACHALGIAHRDLKLENVLVFNDAVLKLCDFDLSCSLDTTTDDESARGGSPKYAPPELFSDKLRMSDYDDRAADAWSCGIIWFILKAGHFPWEKATKDCLLFAKHIECTYPWPRDNRSELDIKMRRLLCVQIPQWLPLPTAAECAQYATAASAVA